MRRVERHRRSWLCCQAGCRTETGKIQSCCMKFGGISSSQSAPKPTLDEKEKEGEMGKGRNQAPRPALSLPPIAFC